MSEASRTLRKAAVEVALRGSGVSSREARAAAFANADAAELGPAARAFVVKVATTAWQITDDDVDAMKRAGLVDDAIFELAVCAAIGQSTRQLETALAALDEACQEPA